MRSTAVRTTSMPTPRPDRSEIDSAVENPGRKTSCTASTSLSEEARSAGISPRSTALARTRSVSMPAPSSLIVSTTRSPSWRAATRSTPCGGLPLATRTSGVSSPWSRLLRRMWISGSASDSMTFLSASVSSPSTTSDTSLPSFLPMSRTRRPKRWKMIPTGSMRTCMIACCMSSAMRLITEYCALISRASSRCWNTISARVAR